MKRLTKKCLWKFKGKPSCRFGLQKDSPTLQQILNGELRDRYAIAALTGIISARPFTVWDGHKKKELAKTAFEFAEAMMEARKR